jgi:hypothetical protein
VRTTLRNVLHLGRRNSRGAGRPTGVGVGVALVSVCLLVASLGASPTQAATADDPMAFGFFAGGTTPSKVQAVETAMGRQGAYLRVYRSWDDAFPDSDVTWMQSTGHSILVSIKARLKSGTNVSWQAIADSQPGSSLYQNMVRWATAIKAYGRPIMVTFNHEPDTSNSQKSGTPDQFIAAWRKFITVMNAENVTNARYTWIVAVRNFSISPTNRKYAPKYYPGDTWVDNIAVDAFNIYCRTKSGSFANPWRSLATLLDPFMQFVAAHPGPNLVVAEWGSSEDPDNPGRKAQWIADAQTMFKQAAYSRFIAISYWNSTSHNYQNCDFKITSSASATNAFKTMANDPFYSGAIT